MSNGQDHDMIHGAPEPVESRTLAAALPFSNSDDMDIEPVGKATSGESGIATNPSTTSQSLATGQPDSGAARVAQPVATASNSGVAQGSNTSSQSLAAGAWRSWEDETLSLDERLRCWKSWQANWQTQKAAWVANGCPACGECSKKHPPPHVVKKVFQASTNVGRGLEKAAEDAAAAHRAGAQQPPQSPQPQPLQPPQQQQQPSPAAPPPATPVCTQCAKAHPGECKAPKCATCEYYHMKHESCFAALALWQASGLEGTPGPQAKAEKKPTRPKKSETAEKAQKTEKVKAVVGDEEDDWVQVISACVGKSDALRAALRLHAKFGGGAGLPSHQKRPPREDDDADDSYGASRKKRTQ
ncbi:hypothetical protein H2201_000110 [Coniosporium apollinis]|uniref:Uncharacterized protein n=2 Tax=Coniosporium TaxID=2810619 RepID=A0ABQ9P8Z5_9PEZI|nr:hypothetical protein H2199_008250 [Cladosporium sp. JES 115]KAJ9669726.1 hypothetical protein H2201_000110 [Coniosporium apollinis]